MIAALVIVALWTLVLLVVVGATRRPSESAAVALASTEPVVTRVDIALAS